MTESESLITKARRYCMQNHSYWSNRYQNEMSGSNNPYSDSDYNLFPRYLVLDAILQNVLSVVGKEFNSIEECKNVLKKIGLESQSIFTVDSNVNTNLFEKDPTYFGISREKNIIKIKAIQEEREKFINFIDKQSIETILNVKPLPFERRLSKKESNYIREQLSKKWNFGGDYWEPLESKSPRPTLFLMYDHIEYLEKQEIEKSIKEHLESERIFEINENLIDYEIGIELLDINLYESVICDNTFNWVVYGSHESTVAFGGKFLIEKINELYKNKKDKLNKWGWEIN